MAGKLFIVSAPSGAGKTSIIHAVVRHLGSTYDLERLITYTSRPPRPNEQDGYDYHFLSAGEFVQRIKKGFFIEWSDAYEYCYGSPKALVPDLAQGKSFILALDRRGTRQVVSMVSDAILIWMYPESITTLKKRLTRRGTETVKQLQIRLELAQQEIEQERRSPLYHHHVLNFDIQETLKKITKIIRNSLYHDLD